MPRKPLATSLLLGQLGSFESLISKILEGWIETRPREVVYSCCTRREGCLIQARSRKVIVCENQDLVVKGKECVCLFRSRALQHEKSWPNISRQTRRQCLMMQLHCNLAPPFFVPNLFVFFLGSLAAGLLRSGEAAEVILNWVRATLGWFWRWWQRQNDVEKKTLVIFEVSEDYASVLEVLEEWWEFGGWIFYGWASGREPTRNFVLRSTSTQSWVMKFGHSWRRVMNPRVKS